MIVSKGTNSQLLMELQTCVLNMEINMVVPRSIGNWPTSRSGYTTLAIYPKDIEFFHKDTWSTILFVFILELQKLEITMVSHRRMDKKMWYIYAMKYYSTVKNMILWNLPTKW